MRKKIVQFKAGDVVKVKHSDTLMTVESVSSSTTSLLDIGCIWFDFDNRVQRGNFRQETLKFVK